MTIVPQTHPSVKFSFGQSSCKGEDVVVVLPKNAWPQLRDGQAPITSNGPLGLHDEFALFCVFDGHNGVLAAKYISETLLNRLVDKLPPGKPPTDEDSPQFLHWRQGIVRALAEVLSEAHLSFAKLGQLAGCTVTIVLQTGWLVTCANLGDSRCVIDNGLEVVCLTDDHRVATNQQERRRVEHTGALIAPVCVSGVGPAKDVNNGVGPLRIWPGGVCLSRGIGDFDLGNIIVPWPNVVQVRVPATGARVMVCSDGVWDAFDHTSRIYKLSRTWPVENVPQRMISSIVRAYGGLRDDTSIIVVDVMPPGRDFSENLKKSKLVQAATARRNSQAAKAAAAKAAAAAGGGAPKSSGGGSCLCFGSKPAVVDDDPTPAPAPTTPSLPTRPPPPLVVEDISVQPLQVLDKQDIAEVLGQFPQREATPAEWAEPTIINRLLQNHQLAFETWKRAAMNGALDSTPRPSMEFTTTTAATTAEQPATRGEDFTVRAGKVAVPTRTPGSVHTQQPSPFSQVAAEDITVRAGIAYPAANPSLFDSLPREIAITPKTPAPADSGESGGSDSRRQVRFSVGPDVVNGLGDGEEGGDKRNGVHDMQSNASVRFGRNVASSSEEYARKFGRYHDLPRQESDAVLAAEEEDGGPLEPMPSFNAGVAAAPSKR